MQQTGVMQTGTVRKFDTTRGFGFIHPDDGDRRDVFVHYSQIVDQRGFRTLEAGQTVMFALGEHDGRPCAVDVQVVEPAEG